MRKIILGGGLVALLARDILGSDWEFIPMGGSTFYSFNPPLADNYVIKDPVIDTYMEKYALIPIYRKTAYSIAGQLTYNHAIALDAWLHKIYGSSPPSQAAPYWKSHSEYFSYGDCFDMFRVLRLQYINELKETAQRGRVVRIHDHIIETDKGNRIEYDEIISTIPLPALIEYIGHNSGLQARDLFCYRFRTNKLDFEGATHLHVVDPQILFYKATQLDTFNYIIYATEPIEKIGQHLMMIMNKFELVGGTTVPRAIPLGEVPNYPELIAANIETVGSLASWDDCLDIGSCIKRLLKKANSGQVANPRQTIG